MPIVTLKEEMAREFFMRRPWLHGDAADDLISEDDYQSLKIRDGRFWKSIDERGCIMADWSRRAVTPKPGQKRTTRHF